MTRHCGEVDGIRIAITDHALARMVEMGMPSHAVCLTISEPDETFESKRYPGDTCYRRGKWTLATRRDGDMLVVKTALYARLRDWVEADRRGRLAADRELRTDTGIPA